VIDSLYSSQRNAMYPSSRDLVHVARTQGSRTIVRKTIPLAAIALLATSCAPVFGQRPAAGDFKFVNVADSNQGFTSFATFPSINRRGTAAFEAMGGAFGDGVFKWIAVESSPQSEYGGTARK